ncbi:bifunctional 2-C-methyl-D-erythritol 4-phosphate cytidylyltransferase/2-C-methyl-D-erythritol 2,4-cyclodiphosphate synthase [Sphingomonas daechungensis]|uniref:bifunctional 2-C-methyl-D-erythritol 4-phosphate cytidylyltransferase/2-C-methyl-D-erythritol 2,4-cyclodiphosphate synthase n=1 Tax=Sphingomonas daechungensis TaxID=1176646 RepID=UPI0031E9B9CB
MSVTALIVAAGKGERLGGEVPKQYQSLGGRPVLRWAVEALIRHPSIDQVRVVIGEGQDGHAREALDGLAVGDLIIGGAERSNSVLNGLHAIGEGAVLVHDAARPFCPPEVVERLLAALEQADGSVPVLPVADTLASGGQFLEAPVDRRNLFRVQTPQAFHVEDLIHAYQEAGGASATDESTVMLSAGLKVATVEGDPMLEKLTMRADWERAEAILASRLVSRTGMGFDVHAFAGEGPIMLGGIPVPHLRGLSGHSDADVALHAITDALLGAAGLGDIGEHFPPSDPQWKGASSDLFLKHAATLIRDQGGLIDHVDVTIVAEEPKIGPHRSAIRARIAEILQMAIEQVSVKATTTEGLGFTGRREGMAAQAVASIRLGFIR